MVVVEIEGIKNTILQQMFYDSVHAREEFEQGSVGLLDYSKF